MSDVKRHQYAIFDEGLKRYLNRSFVESYAYDAKCAEVERLQDHLAQSEQERNDFEAKYWERQREVERVWSMHSQALAKLEALSPTRTEEPKS